MKLDVNANLKNLGGETDLMDETGKPIALRTVIANGLLNPPAEGRLNAEESLHRYALALRVHSTAGPVSLTAEEAALIKRVIAEHYAPLVVGQVFGLIEAE